MAILLLPILGGIFTAFDHGTWNSSLRYTSAANATLLGNTAPLWVALISWLVFRQKLRGLFWLGLAFALGGAVIVLGSDFIRHPSIGLGDLLAMAAGVFYAGYFIVTERGRQKLDTLSYVWLVDLFATVALLLITLGMKLPLSGYPTQSYLAFLGAAMVSQVGGYLSIGYALGHLPASVVSPTLIGQPVVTALLAIPLLGEAIADGAVAGGPGGAGGHLPGAPEPRGESSGRVSCYGELNVRQARGFVAIPSTPHISQIQISAIYQEK